MFAVEWICSPAIFLYAHVYVCMYCIYSVTILESRFNGKSMKIILRAFFFTAATLYTLSLYIYFSCTIKKLSFWMGLILRFDLGFVLLANNLMRLVLTFSIIVFLLWFHHQNMWIPSHPMVKKYNVHATKYRKTNPAESIILVCIKLSKLWQQHTYIHTNADTYFIFNRLLARPFLVGMNFVIICSEMMRVF